MLNQNIAYSKDACNDEWEMSSLHWTLTNSTGHCALIFFLKISVKWPFEFPRNSYVHELILGKPWWVKGWSAWFPDLHSYQWNWWLLPKFYMKSNFKKLSLLHMSSDHNNPWHLSIMRIIIIVWNLLYRSKRGQPSHLTPSRLERATTRANSVLQT